MKKILIFICVLLVLGLVSMVFGETAIHPNQVNTGADAALNYAYDSKAIRVSELATAIWDTTLTSMSTTDTLTIVFDDFVTYFEPLVIALYAPDADCDVLYYGSGINALTGGDVEDSFLRSGISQNWRIKGLDSLKISPQSITTDVDVYIRGLLDR